MDGKTLFASADQSRYFLVPDGTDLPEGDFEIADLLGNHRSCDPVVLDVFEITEAQAKELMAARLREWLGRGKAMLGGLFAALQDANTGRPTDSPAQADSDATVANALGVTEQQLHDDPDAVLDGIKRAAAGIQASARELISSDPATAEQGQARMQAIADRVRTEGGPALDDVAARVEELPEVLREALSNPELVTSINRATERLREISAALEQKTGSADEPEA